MTTSIHNPVFKIVSINSWFDLSSSVCSARASKMAILLSAYNSFSKQCFSSSNAHYMIKRVFVATCRISLEESFTKRSSEERISSRMIPLRSPSNSMRARMFYIQQPDPKETLTAIRRIARWRWDSNGSSIRMIDSATMWMSFGMFCIKCCAPHRTETTTSGQESEQHCRNMAMMLCWEDEEYTYINVCFQERSFAILKNKRKHRGNLMDTHFESIHKLVPLLLHSPETRYS